MPTRRAYTYNEQGQRTQEFFNSFLDLTYDQWDSSGRPVHGTYSTGGSITRDYDDVKHSRVDRSVYSNGLAETNARTFDANGDVISLVRDLSGTVSSHLEATMQIMATDKICK